MGGLQIVFQGICTHFRKEFNPALPVPHRTVLINSSDLTIRPPDFPPIPVHVGTITRPLNISGPGDTIVLNGVSLRVLNETGPITYGSLYPTIPNLTALELSDAGITLGAPRDAVFLEQDTAWTYAQFNFTAGEFAACSADGAATVTVSVETTSEGDQEIEVTSYDGTVTTYIYADSSTVYVANMDPSQRIPDPDNHFLLHYLCAATIPPVASLVIPPRFSGPSCGIGPLGGPGCADSNYP